MELTPMREAGSVRFPLNQELNRVFDEFFGDSIFSPRPGAGWFPAIDIAEAENEEAGAPAFVEPSLGHYPSGTTTCRL
jgi:hypothetical protein